MFVDTTNIDVRAALRDRRPPPAPVTVVGVPWSRLAEDRTVMRRHTIALSMGTAAAVAAFGAWVVTAPPASAAAGCSVTYTLSGQWPGGFGANVTIKNLGDPISS